MQVVRKVAYLTTLSPTRLLRKVALWQVVQQVQKKITMSEKGGTTCVAAETTIIADNMAAGVIEDGSVRVEKGSTVEKGEATYLT